MSMTSRIKRVLALVALVIVGAVLTGCGASFTVRDYVENGVRYSLYELSMDKETANALESTATEDKNGVKYTVEGYFYELFEHFLGCELVRASKNKGYTVVYKKAHLGGVDVSTNLKFKTTHTENPFIRTYTSVAPDPFNGLRAEYDNAEPGRSSTVMEILKNGRIVYDEHGDTEWQLPSVTQAFPYAATVSPDGLKLNYVYTGSSRMESSGTAEEVGDKISEYTFTRYFDDADRTITFKYERAVPYGWYLVALLAGVATFLVIFLLTRPKKEKPTLLDRFPYNPEEYRGYEKNLPANRK